jgi:hypothetical protein
MHATSLVTIPGPAGELEASFVRDDSHAIVSCHPHPQYGGSMHDAVIDTVERVARAHHFATLKFNFRGVGASTGSFANGIGEVDDLLAALAWLRATVPDRPIWIAGYSFGSNVAWRALGRAGALAGVVLIAPPIGLMDFGAATNVSAPLYVIAGDRDDYVDPAQLSRWARDATPAAALDIVAGADHFFSGGHAELARALDRVLSNDRVSR